MPLRADAFDLEANLKALHAQYPGEPRLHIAQNDGMSLSEAIESVRRRTGGRVVSAETKVQGDREVHYIKTAHQFGWKTGVFKYGNHTTAFLADVDGCRWIGEAYDNPTTTVSCAAEINTGNSTIAWGRIGTVLGRCCAGELGRARAVIIAIT